MFLSNNIMYLLSMSGWTMDLFTAIIVDVLVKCGINEIGNI